MPDLSSLVTTPTVNKLLWTIIGLIVIVLAARLINRTLNHRVDDPDLRYRARKFVTFLSYVAAILFAASVFSDRLQSLTVAFGVAGAGIAFALQEVIVSVAGWIAISLGDFYGIGQRVQLGGIKGDVIDIGLLRTTIMECGEWVNGDNYNGRIVRVANSFVFKEPVFNYSADFPFLWDEITIPVKYGSDHHLVREILREVAQDVVGDYVPFAQQRWQDMLNKYLIEPATVEPTVSLVANDNWMQFTLRYVVDYKKRRSTKDQLFSGILDRINEAEDKIALASATFELVGAPDITVNLARES